jgi:hypothetical protein
MFLLLVLTFQYKILCDFSEKIRSNQWLHPSAGLPAAP